MDHSGHRKLQQEILDQVLALLKNDPNVLGCLISGSYARNEQDAFSDLDLACYLRDEELSGRQELYDQVGKIAPTLWHLWIYGVHALYLFENGVRLDLDFLKPSDIDHMSYVYTDTIIAYDPDGDITAFTAQIESAPPGRTPQMVPTRRPCHDRLVLSGCFARWFVGLNGARKAITAPLTNSPTRSIRSQISAHAWSKCASGLWAKRTISVEPTPTAPHAWQKPIPILTRTKSSNLPGCYWPNMNIYVRCTARKQRQSIQREKWKSCTG